MQAPLLPFWVSKPWYFSIFSLSFPATLTSTGTAILMIIPFRSFLSIKIMSGFLTSVMLPHWTMISHNTFTSSFSTALSGTCSYHFSVCSITHSSYKGPTLLCSLLYSFWPNFPHHIHLLGVPHFHLFLHIICTGGFHLSYWLYMVCPDDLFTVYIRTLLFQSSNHFWITTTKFILINFLWHFPDKLFMNFLFMPVLLKLLCFLFFKFPTRYSIFSIDCLSCCNSSDEVFFWIGNTKTKTIFLFSNATFHTHQTSASLFPLYVQSVHIAIWVLTLHRLSFFFLISCLHLLIHSLSTVVFLLSIWIQPLRMHLLVSFCFPHLVLILRPIKAFSYIPLLFLLSFLFILSYPIQQCPNMCIHSFRHSSLLHHLGALYSFTSNYFPSLHGKNSTFFHSILHPNISTKDMNSSHKCIHLFFSLAKQLQIIHEQQIIQLPLSFLIHSLGLPLSINDKGNKLKKNNCGERGNIPLFTSTSQDLHY